MRSAAFVLSALLLCGCAAGHRILEADPVTHVLVMLPLLAISGSLLVAATELRSLVIAERYANALSLLATFTILFWMLPRYIDASLTSPAIACAKFVSLPILVGGVLAVAWRQSTPLLRGFLKANAISMLGVLAFLYTHAPVRICNSYLVADQERLGYGFLFAAFGLAAAWTLPLFLPPSSNRPVPSAAAETAGP